jgi:hypothetical protein
MKITKLLFISIAVILFSCSEDDDPIPTSEGMVGSWTVTSIDYKGTTTTTVAGITSRADFAGTGKDMDLTTSFTASPNKVTSSGTYTIVLKTTAGGTTSTDEFLFDEIVTDGTWSLSGKTMTVTMDGGAGTQEATIMSQTDTTLVMKVDIDEVDSGGGFTMTTKVSGVYTFIKK